MIFVYGENDPWTAGAFELDPTRDMYAFVVPRGNHGAQLSDRALPPESHDLAMHVLELWMGVKPRSIEAVQKAQNAQEADAEPLFFHLPPRKLRL